MYRSCIALLLLLNLAGCDYVDEPIAPDDGGNGGADSTVTRRVLLEEFTGHRCSTCPAAHVVAQQLDALYGDRLIVVGIHATETFGAPLDPPAVDGRYSTDFRTAAGNAYASTFGVVFLPTGLVSRKPFNSSTTLSQGSWGSAIVAIIDEEALFDLWFSDLEYNASSNTFSTTVDVAVLRTIDADHKLTVYLLEDPVLDWQLNAAATPPDVPGYEHRHVLRTTVTPPFGVLAVAAGTEAGDTLRFDFTGIPLDPDWDAQNCSLVGYLANATTNEVMQATERKFQP